MRYLRAGLIGALLVGCIEGPPESGGGHLVFDVMNRSSTAVEIGFESENAAGVGEGAACSRTFVDFSLAGVVIWPVSVDVDGNVVEPRLVPRMLVTGNYVIVPIHILADGSAQVGTPRAADAAPIESAEAIPGCG